MFFFLQTALEVVSRASSSSEVLSLNLTNLVILLALKVTISLRGEGFQDNDGVEVNNVDDDDILDYNKEDDNGANEFCKNDEIGGC